jgi:hypothetical protein
VAAAGAELRALAVGRMTIRTLRHARRA